MDAFSDEDFDLERGVPGVRPVSEKTSRQMRYYVDDYGAVLAKLPPEAWQTSVCQWMEGYWDVLVDLYVVDEGASDLALELRVYEAGGDYAFDIRLICVR
ncbi:hypothetical protein GN331_14965 [Lysobacter sp. HX-5-24]|uniref:DUF7668 domain-containing protein n=1 Tax=Noviluteimonas gilva TaxID=2682097 RepID=A0A7C9M569_9GAMM|nr:hypothetical protein [Lysobacter gilvus]